jgi:hypothetical protein
LDLKPTLNSLIFINGVLGHLDRRLLRAIDAQRFC